MLVFFIARKYRYVRLPCRAVRCPPQIPGPRPNSHSQKFSSDVCARRLETTAMILKLCCLRLLTHQHIARTVSVGALYSTSSILISTI